MNAWDPSGHYKVTEAIEREIKGMTKYEPKHRIFLSLYASKYLKNIVKERVVKTWCKKKNKTFIGVEDYELLARTLYFESSSNNKKAQKRRNEIITFYKVVKSRMENGNFGGNTMRGVLTKPMQFCGLTYFKGKKGNQRGYAKIKINRKKIDLSWVRSVVIATVAEINDQKIKYPDNNTYYFWHSKEDWKKLRKRNSNKWISFAENPGKYYRVKIVKRYSDTYFYDYWR